ncbi:MAG TPA: MoxR family ATPase [Chitinophagales bacterium]|jgi:MoxR-like ATPase|nr:MoxR family ATPase [Chitinophagales bacterium]MBP6154232.1 MoxR family ATPase [Chitinophagales bacterium]HQV78302.1 MoxR family ATPase [Chitinophagales bacterium]HQW79453.1 MoxR family ATPase [Chitinophagales bacterium]HRB66889.1 MoxR family ATPase [Chitinophagales bacterium]
MESIDIKALNEKIQNDSIFLEVLNNEISKSIVGQKYMLERLMIALLSQGHILLEGVPGLAKTLAIKSLSDAIDTKFSRIQFTPDLLPADILGTMIYNQAKGNFEVKKGPVFSNFLLADEINRAPAKVQSALLQSMQERMVTLGDTTYKLEEPFLVMATQNPIEQEGTYNLPEAQVDRFMLKVKISYPEFEDERQIMRQNVAGLNPNIKPVITASTILQARDTVRQVYMDEKIEKYILDIIFATRDASKYKIDNLKHLISYGGSPRASISLAMASKAYAFIKRRGYVIPEDVRAVAHDVLRHRIGITYEAEAENITQEHIIDTILNRVEVP